MTPIPRRAPRRAVLFDLDDTLYDHQFACWHALDGLRDRFPSLRGSTTLELREEYNALMDALHPLTLAGELPQHAARTERIRRLFGQHRESISRAEARRRAALYRKGYLRAERGVPGGREVVRELWRRGHPIGIVTNNATAGQREKLRACGVEPYIRALVVSQSVGCSKPDPRIFQRALERLAVPPSQATFVGDSFRNDVAGAAGAGLTPVWLNRRRERPTFAVDCVELSSFRPRARAVELILHAHERPGVRRAP